MVAKHSIEQYAAMKVTQEKKLTKDDLIMLINSQIGQPTVLPEDTLRTFIKDTIEKSIDEKIPLGKIINDLKADYDQKIEALETDNRVLKKTILEQQKFLEGMRREKVKNNIFITGIPSSHTIKENNVTDKEIIIQQYN